MGPWRKRQSDLEASGDARAAGDRIRRILENVPDMWALIGADGALQYVSPHIEKALGYGRSEVEGRSVFDFIHPEDGPRAVHEFADTVEQEGERVLLSLGFAMPQALGFRLRSSPTTVYRILTCRPLFSPPATFDSGRRSKTRFDAPTPISKNG